MTLYKNMLCTAAFALTLFGTATAEAKDIKAGSLVIHDPWIRATQTGATVAGAFAKIENAGKDGDVLVSAAVEGVPTVQIHEMKMEGDVMKMKELADGLPIAAGAAVELKPGSFHIMLMGLKTGFKAGDHVTGALTFKNAGKVDVEFEVKDGKMGGMNMPGMKMN